METRESISIDAPIELVFEAVTERVLEWSPTIVRREPLDDSYPEIGSKFQSEVDHGNQSKSTTFEGVVTLYERPHAMAYRLRHENYDIETGFMLDDRNGPTVVIQRSNFEVSGWIGWIYKLAQQTMLKAVRVALRRELECLKAFSEQEANDARQ